MKPTYPTLVGRYGADGHCGRCIYTTRRHYERSIDRCKYRPTYLPYALLVLSQFTTKL
jgi:hypothetical protein